MRPLTFAVIVSVLISAVERLAEAESPASGGSVCIARERTLPIDEAGSLVPVRMPRGLYSFRVDGRAPIPVRSDRGTLVRGLDPARAHVVVLLRRNRRVAATTFLVTRDRPVCFGLANYSGALALRPLERCGCLR